MQDARGKLAVFRTRGKLAMGRTRGELAMWRTRGELERCRTLLTLVCIELSFASLDLSRRNIINCDVHVIVSPIVSHKIFTQNVPCCIIRNSTHTSASSVFFKLVSLLWTHAVIGCQREVGNIQNQREVGNMQNQRGVGNGQNQRVVGNVQNPVDFGMYWIKLCFTWFVQRKYY